MAICRASGELVCVYAVGNVEAFPSGVDPNKLYVGTTWVRVKGRVIVGVDESQSEFNTVNKTGGAKTHSHTTGSHTLTVAQIPSHTHGIYPIDGQRNSDTGVAWGKQGVDAALNGTSGATGGNQAHNHGATGGASNLMTYVTKFLWERTS